MDPLVGEVKAQESQRLTECKTNMLVLALLLGQFTLLASQVSDEVGSSSKLERAALATVAPVPMA